MLEDVKGVINEANNLFADANHVGFDARSVAIGVKGNQIMAFDPSKPAEDSPLDAAEMRSQLTGLKALIDAQQATIADLQSNVSLTFADFAGGNHFS